MVVSRISRAVSHLRATNMVLKENDAGVAEYLLRDQRVRRQLRLHQTVSLVFLAAFWVTVASLVYPTPDLGVSAVSAVAAVVLVKLYSAFKVLGTFVFTVIVYGAAVEMYSVTINPFIAAAFAFFAGIIVVWLTVELIRATVSVAMHIGYTWEEDGHDMTLETQ